MEPSLIISIFALIFSIASIVWNIIRDILLDSIKLSPRIFMGEEIHDDKGMQRAVSAGTRISVMDSEKTTHAKKAFFEITNIGRRDIEIDCIRAEYTNGHSWYLPINEKRYLKPYESTNANTENLELKEHLKNKTIGVLYVQDTKGKKWNFSNNDIFNASKQLN